MEVIITCKSTCTLCKFSWWNQSSPAQHITETLRQLYHNQIQIMTLKLVAMFSCHGEYHAGVCQRGQKSHSHVIKAAWLETQECIEYLRVISISPLFSSLSTFLFLKGNKHFCHSALLQGHTFLTPLHHIHMTNTKFLQHSFSFPLFLSSLCFPPYHSSRTKGCMALPLVKAPSHCKRMSLSHCKQSAFIMSYLPRPPWQQSW